MQAGLGGASATVHRAAELPFILRVLQEHCSSHSITAQLCSSCLHCPAASTASRGVGQGSRELCPLNSILGQCDTKICCFLTVLCQLVHCPRSRVLHWPWTVQGAGREKPWCDMFPGAPVPPALLPPAHS